MNSIEHRWNNLRVEVIKEQLMYRKKGDRFYLMVTFRMLPVGIIRKIPVGFGNSLLWTTIDEREVK